MRLKSSSVVAALAVVAIISMTSLAIAEAQVQGSDDVAAAATCTTPASCGSKCVACPTPQNGAAACVKQSSAYVCSATCFPGFTAKEAGGKTTCTTSLTTGLVAPGKGRKGSSLATRKTYSASASVAVSISGLGSGGVVTRAQLTTALTAACAKARLSGAACQDALLLALTPSAYSSSTASDAPGNRAYISPSKAQATCSADVGFAVTAAAEAAVALFLARPWNRVSLSEQDVSFCKLSPPVDCAAGSNYGSFVSMVKSGGLSHLASRTCYPYKSAPGTGAADCSKAQTCGNQLPSTGAFSIANKGAALNSVAKIKQQIMLSGGVLTSVAIGPKDTFRLYSSSTPVYEPADLGRTVAAELHAVFCYGWVDSPDGAGKGYWICKNSWGPSWGASGSINIAYGSAYIMQPDYTFGLDFKLKTPAALVTGITASLKKVYSQYPVTSTCVLFKMTSTTRLIRLVNDLLTLAANSPGAPVTAIDIVEDVVAGNLGYLSKLSGFSKGPFRVCGSTASWLASAVGGNNPSPPPPDCPANSARDGTTGVCVCNPGLIPTLNRTTVTSCITSASLTSCPGAYPIEVKTEDTKKPILTSCITVNTPCPADFSVALYVGVPPTRLECRPNIGGCDYPGYNQEVTGRDQTLAGCFGSDSTCPFVPYRSGQFGFGIDLCADVTACPTTGADYRIPALAPGSTQPLACLTLGVPGNVTKVCPALPDVNYPLEVVAADPVNCGSTANPCNSTRVLQCLTNNATCPASQSLRLYRTFANATSTRIIVECRPMRPSCDFSSSGMGTVTPNKGAYVNAVFGAGGALEGCATSDYLPLNSPSPGPPKPNPVGLTDGKEISVTTSEWYYNSSSSWQGSTVSVSSDSGFSWAPVSSPAGRWLSLAISCSGARQFAALAPLGQIMGSSVGVYASYDAGVSWANILPLPGNNVISVASNDGGTGVAAGSFKTVQIGVSDNAVPPKFTWKQVLNVTQQVYLSAAMSGNGNTLVAWTDASAAPAQQQLLYVSVDAGKTWTQQSPAGAVSQPWWDVAISADGKTIAAVQNEQQLSTAVYMSVDAGKTWARREVGFRITGAVAMSRTGNYIVASGLDISRRRFSGNDLTVLLVSSDSGNTWQRLASTFTTVFNVGCSSTCSTLAVVGVADGDSTIGVYVRYDFSTSFQRSPSLPGQVASGQPFPSTLTVGDAKVAVSSCAA